MSPFKRKKRHCRKRMGSSFFKPRAIPLSQLKVNRLELDELEAFSLCDVEGLNQAQAAKRMNISPSTLQRLLYAARKKTAQALYYGMAIEIASTPDIEFTKTDTTDQNI